MKKLMILAATVTLAVATQAATCNWVALNVYEGNTTDKATGIAYFMTTATAATSAWVEGLTADQCMALVGSSYSYTPSAAGTYSVSAANKVDNATLGLTDGTGYTSYLVVFDGATIADSTSFYVSNTKSFQALTGTSNASISFGNQMTASQNAANWTAMAPEPTSGLLLLMGMGVLALRRKQK